LPTFSRRKSETKIAIIEKKMQENKIELTPAVAQYIASHVESNIRELEGFLIRISAYSSLTNREINLDLVREVLKKLVQHNNKEDVSIEGIIKVRCGSKLNVKIADIKAHNKNKNSCFSQTDFHVSGQKVTESFLILDIGQKIGGRDHSTVIYANKKIFATRWKPAQT
jgi:chromosomal replication initiator protein